MTIGIMGAMPEEVEALLGHLQRDQPARHAGRRTYHTGRLFGADVVIVQSRMGKVAAASSATHLIVEYGVRSLLFTGVAGAVSKDVRIGDIVVGSALMQHDLDATPIYPRYEAPLLEVARFTSPGASVNALAEAARGFLADRSESIDAMEEQRTFQTQAPRAHVGLIISGDQFISDDAEVERLRREIPDALCVEMEGAAVAQVCYEHDIPCAVIRTISDDASHGAELDFARFVELVAGRYALGVIERYLRSVSVDAA